MNVVLCLPLYNRFVSNYVHETPCLCHLLSSDSNNYRCRYVLVFICYLLTLILNSVYYNYDYTKFSGLKCLKVTLLTIIKLKILKKKKGTTNKEGVGKHRQETSYSYKRRWACCTLLCMKCYYLLKNLSCSKVILYHFFSIFKIFKRYGSENKQNIESTNKFILDVIWNVSFTNTLLFM